ncbi:MAG: hypothetical protein HFJ91_00825 [Muribaculaceae bacterium]|nr:hypothetical protein [Muribaculaceae bacterium]
MASSLFTWLVYGRKLRKQEIKLNEYMLKERQNEDSEKRKASLRIYATYFSKGIGEITVANEGISEARNIRIASKCWEQPNPPVLLKDKKVFPCQLIAPGSSVSVRYHLIGTPKNRTPLAVVFWDDDFSSDRSQSYSLNIVK